MLLFNGEKETSKLSFVKKFVKTFNDSNKFPQEKFSQFTFLIVFNVKIKAMLRDKVLSNILHFNPLVLPY